MKNKLIELIGESLDYIHEKCDEVRDGCETDCPYWGGEEDPDRCARLLQATFLIEHGVTMIPETGIEDMSDGYHTFKDLYYQRMMLTAALVKAYKPLAWKSHRHEDGELCFDGGWFIVGIATPQGDYTYHYEDKYWDLFECEELPVGKPWDGHTEEDVTRLLSLAPGNNIGHKWIPVEERLPTVCDADADNCVLAIHFASNKRYYHWRSVAENPQDFTHWMPLPEPPKEEER